MTDRSLSAALAVTLDTLSTLVARRKDVGAKRGGEVHAHMATWPGGIGELPNFGKADRG